MKELLTLFLLLSICAVVAQTGQPTPSAPSAAYSNAPGFTNYPGSWFTNSSGTNSFSADFAARLLNLQHEMEQLLPILQSLNDATLLSNSNLLSGLGYGPGGSLSNSYGYAEPTGNPGSAVNQSSATNPIPAFSTTFPGGSTITTLPDTPATPTSVNGTNTATLMAIARNRLAGGIGFYGSDATNVFSLTPAQQNALRSLILLQNDLERTLPIVNSINSGALSAQGALGGTNAVGTNRP
jgi:hypothetical protein